MDRRTERGATLVEYALIVALVAVGTLGGIDAMQSGAQRATEQTASEISTRSVPSVPEPDGDGGGDATTTTTTQPPTTTTTTTPTTTTTTTTTTTIPPASTMSASWGNATTQTNGWSNWKALATLTVRDNRSQAVSGATVRIGVQYYRDGRWRDASDIPGSTNSNGQVTIDSGWYARNGGSSNRVDQIRFVVESVSKSGLTYTSGGVTTTLSRP